MRNYKMEYVYAALLLHKLGKAIDVDSVGNIVKTAGAEVNEAKVKSLVASLEGVDIEAELANAVVASAAAAPAASQDAAPAEEKPEEKKEASAAGLSALFG